jgi:2-amino-4-hydroxy-6-hydroxymethyldihydropteridine diphosphokinase
VSKIHFIAIGANLASAAGPARGACEAAAQGLAHATGLARPCRSRWYSSAPVPEADQPRFINGVVRLEGEIAPEQLLAVLQSIEQGAGRVRGVTNGPRTLDLDIVDMAGLVRAQPSPVLPHPRAHMRAFVLLPLRDVCPDWVHPVLRLGIAALIAALPAQDIYAV